MRVKSALLTATLLTAPLAAAAQTFNGFYVGAGAGFNGQQDVRIKPPTGTSLPTQIVTNAGYAALGSAGYGFGNGVRIELEGNYRDNAVRHLTGTTYPSAGSGSNRSYGGMFNALFDMDVGSPWVYPYLGAGAGYVVTNLDQVAATNTSIRSGLRINATAGNFAYQAIAGLSFPVYGVPGLSLTAEYRFFAQNGNQEYAYAATNGSAANTGRLKLGVQYNNSALLGVRYAFNVVPPSTPAPPTAAVPAADAVRSYLVFFDWDRPDLTDRARRIVAEAAANATRAQSTRIEVAGYTDTSGSAAYNQRLSMRRAQTVAAELIKDGVPRDSISIQAFGETHLLVPTAQGVREPQNRRVEIVIR